MRPLHLSLSLSLSLSPPPCSFLPLFFLFSYSLFFHSLSVLSFIIASSHLPPHFLLSISLFSLPRPPPLPTDFFPILYLPSFSFLPSFLCTLFHFSLLFHTPPPSDLFLLTYSHFLNILCLPSSHTLCSCSHFHLSTLTIFTPLLLHPFHPFSSSPLSLLPSHPSSPHTFFLLYTFPSP